MGVMEIERRPHWTDDLIDAVIRAESDAHDYEYRAMAAIATVEDWQKETFVAASAILAERIERAETAIQRVREVCDTWLADGAAWGPYSAKMILRALEGDVDE